MCTLPMTGRPKWPIPVGFLIMAVVLLAALSGCQAQPYHEVPECNVAKPPQPEQYLDATPDEKLVIIGDAYIHQVKSVMRCNNNIRLINARNNAVQPD